MKAFLCGIAFLFLLSCGSSGKAREWHKWLQDDGRLKVLSTTAMIDSLVKEIVGEDVDTLVLIEGELDPHSYEPVKGDQEKFLHADLIFYNGLGLEHGPSLAAFLHDSDKAYAVGDIIEKAFPEKILYLDGVKDPHIWMDMDLFSKAIPYIVLKLSEKSPEYAEHFAERGEALLRNLEKEHKANQECFASLNDSQRYLVTSHDAFAYFTRAYIAPSDESTGRMRCQAPEGLAPEGQLSAADLRFIVDHLKKYKIRVIFPESNVSEAALRKIAEVCREEGFQVHVVKEALYGDSMGAKSYQEMIRHNAEVIARNLEKNGQ